MVYELVLTIFTQKWLNFENLSLFFELSGVSWLHNNSTILEDVTTKFILKAQEATIKYMHVIKLDLTFSFN